VGIGEASSAEEADQQSSDRSVATLLTATGPSWELHGPRVARRLRHRTRCHNTTIRRASGRHASGRRASGRRASGRRASGRRASGRPASGRPASGRPASGRHASLLHTLCCNVFFHASAHVISTPVFCNPCELSLTLWLSDSSQYMCVCVPVYVCETAVLVQAKWQWR